jgi:hypothetical protein
VTDAVPKPIADTGTAVVVCPRNTVTDDGTDTMPLGAAEMLTIVSAACAADRVTVNDVDAPGCNGVVGGSKETTRGIAAVTTTVLVALEPFKVAVT